MCCDQFTGFFKRKSKPSRGQELPSTPGDLLLAELFLALAQCPLTILIEAGILDGHKRIVLLRDVSVVIDLQFIPGTGMVRNCTLVNNFLGLSKFGARRRRRSLRLRGA